MAQESAKENFPMTYEPTPAQMAGIELHEKERKERCERILKKYEKVKYLNPKKLLEEKFKKFKEL